MATLENFDWCAEVIRQGASCEQIVKRFPQFDAGVVGCVSMSSDEPVPGGLETMVWLDTLRHDWKPNGGTQTGSVSCSKCDSWSLSSPPVFGCGGERNG